MTIFNEYIKTLKARKQELNDIQADTKTKLDVAITSNDLTGTLNIIATIQNIDREIDYLNDRIAFMQMLVDSADPDVQAADNLYNDLIATYQGKGITKNLVQKVEQLRKLLRY